MIEPIPCPICGRRPYVSEYHNFAKCKRKDHTLAFRFEDPWQDPLKEYETLVTGWNDMIRKMMLTEMMP